MGKFEQERLNTLFEVESIKSTLMSLGEGTFLKIVADLGSKDKGSNKRRFYEEVRYPSDKYKNTDFLITSNFQVNCYLMITYPNPSYGGPESRLQKNHVLMIRAYAMDDLISTVKKFNSMITRGFKSKDGMLYVSPEANKEVASYPSPETSISFAPDIFTPANNPKEQKPGVRIGINEEFYVIVNAETTWSEFVYRITRCDLTMLGFQMIQSYMSLLPGMAVSEMGSKAYVSASRYKPFWGEDPDEIINNPNSVGVRNKPITNQDKAKKFLEEN